MLDGFWYWAILVLLNIGMLGANFLYSWLIIKTRFYKPEFDLEYRISKLFWEKESASKIAFSMMYLFFYAVIVAPIWEELIFRDLLFRDFFNSWGFWAAALLSAGIWAVLHIKFYAIPIIFPMGIALAYIYFTYGLFWVILAHLINNTIAVFETLFIETRRISKGRRITLVDFFK